MEEKMHCVSLEGRKRLHITMCSEVVSFNEDEVVLNLENEQLVIAGLSLKVEEVSKSTGDVIITAEVINSIVYKKGRGKAKESIAGRLFK